MSGGHGAQCVVLPELLRTREINNHVFSLALFAEE